VTWFPGTEVKKKIEAKMDHRVESAGSKLKWLKKETM